uniref:Protein YIPF n=2 Tax=Triatoma infestans TaxID=30076 RepID=A0A023F877_TRIIF
MSGLPPQQNEWYTGTQDGSYQFYMGEGEQDFPQQLNFQSFQGENQPVSQSDYYNPGYPAQTEYTGKIFTPSATYSQPDQKSQDFEDEPPLLEELGINPDHIFQKTMAVLNPFRSTDMTILQDTDLAGPLVFCLAFGALLLLSGKVHFSYIYGLGVLGCIGIYMLLSLMTQTGVSFGVVITVLGYCLLPIVILAGINVVFSLQGVAGNVLSGLAILWCSLSSSKLFVTALSMDHQQPLIAYPCALLYGVFALITIF